MSISSHIRKAKKYKGRKQDIRQEKTEKEKISPDRLYRKQGVFRPENAILQEIKI